MKTIEEVKGQVLTTVEPFRVQALRIVSMLGLIAAAIGAADFTGVASFLPPDVAGWLVTGGLAAASVKQGALVVGDYLDNGKRDNSFKFPAVLFLAALAFLALPSCETVQVELTPDGCAMARRVSDSGQAYRAGACVDPGTGKLTRLRVEWQNAEGTGLRATYDTLAKSTVIHYRPTPGGLWLAWGAKAGVSLDGLPEGSGLPALP
jgi:hypothetical protein